MAILEVENVCKSFGTLKAVDSVSFNVEPGYIYGILGPNGAGKTTTIRMIMNIIIPDSGTVKLFGQEMNDALKHRIGYLPEERGLYPKMKVIDLLIFLGEMHGLSAGQAKESAEIWLERFEFSEQAPKTVEELSKGMQQKIQFISTIMHDPDLIILDEPFSGLDPVNVNLVKDIVLDLKKKNKAIMLSTHLMDTAEKLCDDILMINGGKKVLDGRLVEIKSNYGKNALHLEYDGDLSQLKAMEMVNSINDFGNYVEVELSKQISPNQFLKSAIELVEIKRMETHQSSLNEIFIELAKGGVRQ